MVTNRVDSCRPFQFSLRTMFVVTTIVALLAVVAKPAWEYVARGHDRIGIIIDERGEPEPNAYALGWLAGRYATTDGMKAGLGSSMSE